MSDAPPPQRIRFGRCELHPQTRELRLAGVRVAVRRRVFDLLLFLVQQRPRVVAHEELKRAVWQRADVSQPLLARAILEARRACGDAVDEPRIIVTVHGVGYRFAADLLVAGPAIAPPADADAAAEARVDEVRTAIRSARLAVFEHRFAQARALAQEAVERARTLGVRSEEARALLACSLEAMHRRSLPEAAGHARQALQIARGEGFAPLVAEALMALGGLHVLAGDRETGLQHLRDAAQVFSQPGAETNLRACLNWMARAMRDQGELEHALQLCRRAIALHVPAPDARPPLIDRLNEMQLLIELGDREAAAELPAPADAWYRQALEASQALLPELAEEPLGVLRASCLSQQWMALERLGRLDEACAAVAACDAQRERLTEGRQWPDAENRASFRIQRARLLARTGRGDDALAEVSDVLAGAAGETSEGLANLYRIAADVATLAGRHRQAADWLRAHGRALLQTQRNHGATVAAFLAAEMNAQALQQELERARAELRDGLGENARLHRRLRQLGPRGPAPALT